MKKKIKYYLLLCLIITLISLIAIIGCILNKKSSNNNVNPMVNINTSIIKNSTKINEVTQDIFITTTNTTKKRENSNNQNTTIINTTSSTKVNVTTAYNTYQANQELIKKIYNVYGYDVSYNTGESFWYNGTEATILTDENAANTLLNAIYNASGKFPVGFFRNIKPAHGFRIVLYKSINGASGVADYEFWDDYKMILSAENGFPSRVFYHEMWHIIEKYLEYKGSYFNNWSQLNPEGFTYGDNTNTYTPYDYEYDMSDCQDPSIVAFINSYGKTNEREDRAELFADYMFRASKRNYMQSGYTINNKIKAMASALRNYLPNSAGARWERFIDW